MRQRHSVLLLCAGLLAAALGVCSGQLQLVTLKGTTALVVSLSEPADTSATNCTFAFEYTTSAGAVKPTTGISFANCTFNDAQTITLFYATGVSFAGGDRLNLAKDQKALRSATTNTVPWVPLATPVTVQPVIQAVTLTAPTTLEVKLPLESAFAPVNVSACNSALELWPAGGTAAKPGVAFTACSLKNPTTVVLTMSTGSYTAGDGVQVVASQNILLVGTVGYAPSKTPVVASPIIQTASLVSSMGVMVALPTASSLSISDAAGCNAVFAVRNGTVVIPNALSACAVASGGMSVQLTLSNAAFFGSTVSVNTYANQTALRAGPAATGVLYVPNPAISNVAINPTIVSASLTATDKILVTLPASSSFTEANCATVFAIRTPTGATKSIISTCSLVNNTLITINIQAGSFRAGDSVDVASASNSLQIGSTPYAPRAFPIVIRPTVLAAYYRTAGQLLVALPTRSALPSPFAAADCNAALEIRNGNTTKPNAIAGCLLSADGLTLMVNLTSSAAFAPGDTVNVRTGQFKLRAGSVITGPAYVPLAAAVPVNPIIGDAYLQSSTTLFVSLPERSNGITTLADCTAAVALYAADSVIPQATPFSACSIINDGTTLHLTLANADTYTPGCRVDVLAAQSRLRINGTAAGSMAYYAKMASRIAPAVRTNVNATGAYLAAPDTIVLTLPYDSSFTMASPNASHCNAAFELLSSAGAAKTTPVFSACAMNADADAVLLTLSSASIYAAGDAVNVKAGNPLLRAGTTSSASALYAPAATAIAVAPQIVSAAVSNRTIFVEFATAATLASDFDCNATVLLYPGASGSASARTAPFSSCQLSADGKAMTLVLLGDFTSGDGVNLASDQAGLLAGSTAFAPTTSPVSIVEAGIVSALMPAANTVVVTLTYDALLTGSSATDCNALFAVTSDSSANAEPKPSYILACTMAEGDKRTVTVTINTTAYTSGDYIRLIANQTVLRVSSTAGPLFTKDTAVRIRPVIVSAVMVGSSTIEVSLPIASSPTTVSSCSNVLAVQPAAQGADPRSIDSCRVNSDPSTTLSIVLSSYYLGDTVNILSSNGALVAGTTGTGATYAPSVKSLVVHPSLVSATLTAANTVQVVLSEYNSKLEAGADCNSAFVIYPNASTIPKSSPISSCSLSADAVTISLNTAFATGDTINIRSDNTALTASYTMGGASTTLPYAPRNANVPVLPVIASALATSTKTVIVTFPTPASIVGVPVASPSVTPILKEATKAQCDNILAVGSVALEGTGTACKTTTLGGATTMEVTLATSLADADTIDIISGINTASGVTLRAGNGTWGTLFARKSSRVTINPTIQSAVAVALDTILVSLPLSAQFYTAGESPSPTDLLSTTDCSDIFTIGSKVIKSCEVVQSSAPSVVSIKLAEGSPYTTDDTIDIAAAHPATNSERNNKAKLATILGAAYKARGAGVTIRPSIASAVLVSVTDTARKVELNLPVAGTFFQNSPAAAVTSLNPGPCKTILSGGTKFDSGTGISTCSLGTQPGPKLVTITLGAGWSFGDDDGTINILPSHPEAVAAGVASLRVGTTATSSAFATSPVAVKIQPSLLSAVATSSTTIEVTLPASSEFIGADGDDTLSLSAADCSNIILVKSSGTATRSLDATTGVSACTISGSTLTVNLAGGENVYQSGDTIAIVPTHATDSTKARMQTTSGINYAPASTAVGISPVFASATPISPTKVLITLPAASKLYTGSNEVTGKTLNKASCGNIIATVSTTALADVSEACVLSTDGLSLTVTLADDYTPGDSIKIVHTATTGPFSTLRVGTQTLYKSGATTTIQPVPLAAYATSATTVVVVLPVASQLYGPDGVDTGTEPDAVYYLPAAQCAGIFQVLPAGATSQPKTIDSCKQLADSPPTMSQAVDTALGSRLVQITLAEGYSFASGDTVSLVSSHGSGDAYLAAWKDAATDITHKYAAGSAPLTITPGIVSAEPVSATEIKVILPTASALYAAAAAGSTPSPVTTLTKDACGNIIQVYPVAWLANPATSAKALFTDTSDVKACSMSSDKGETTLTVRLNANYAAGDVITINAAATSTGATLRALSGSTTTVYAAYKAPFVTSVPIVPTQVVKAVAMSATTVVVTLPVKSALYTTGTAYVGSLEGCTDAVDILDVDSGASKLPTAPTTACELVDSNDAPGGTSLTLTLASDFSDGDAVTIKNVAAGVASLRVYGTNEDDEVDDIPYGASSSNTLIHPTIISAVATSTKTVVAELLVPGTLYSSPTAAAPAAPATTLSFSECSDVLAFTGGSLTSNPFTCTMSADGRKITVSFTNDVWVAGMTVNIKATHPVSATSAALRSTVKGVAFAAGNDVVVYPVIVSALSGLETNVVTLGLSVPAYLTDGDEDTNAGTNAKVPASGSQSTDCSTLLTITLGTGGALTPTATTGCSIAAASKSSGASVLKVAHANGAFTAPVAVTAKAADSSPFEAVTLMATVPSTGTQRYIPFTADAVISVLPFNKLVSATLVSATVINVTLPAESRAWGSGTSAITDFMDKTTCDGMLSTPGDLAAQNACRVYGKYLVMNLDEAYTAGDMVNVVTGADVSLQYGTVKGDAYKYAPGAVTIRPTIVSAKAVGKRSVEVTLPATSALYEDNVNGDPQLANSINDCASIVEVMPAFLDIARELAATGACVVTGASGSTTLTVNMGEDLAEGDSINIVASHDLDDDPKLQVYTATADGPAYVARFEAVPIAPTILAAVAKSTSTLELTLPFACSLWDSTTLSASLGDANCAKIFAVLPKDSTEARAMSKCELDKTGTLLTVTLKEGSYAPGDTINILETHAMSSATLRAGTSKTGVLAVPSTEAVPIRPVLASAIATDANTVVVSLPVKSALVAISADTADADNVLADCSDFLEMNAGGAVSGCSIDSTGLKLTVTIGSSYADGRTVNVKAALESSDKDSYNSIRATDDIEGTFYRQYAPGGIPVKPALSTATLVSPSRIYVTVPVSSKLMTAPTSSAASVAVANGKSLSGADCSAVVAVSGADSTRALSDADACFVKDDTSFFVELVSGSTYASGDVVNIAAGHPAANKASLVSSANAVAYVPNPVTIRPAIASAIAISSTRIIVTLPVSSALYDGSSDPPTAVATLTATQCGAILDVASNDLAADNACVLSATTGVTTLNVTLAGTDGNTYAAGDQIDIVDGHASDPAELSLRSYASAFDGTVAYTSYAVTIRPGLGAAVARNARRIDITLPVASTRDGSDGECSDFLEVTNGGTAKTVDTCSVITTTLTVNLDSETSFAAGDFVDILSTNNGEDDTVGALLAGSVYYASRPTMVAPGYILSAQAVGLTTLRVKLPVSGYLASATLTSEECAKVLSVTPTGAEAEPKGLNSCWLDRFDPTLLYAQLADGETLEFGDEFDILKDNASAEKPLLAANKDGAAFQPLLNPVPISHTVQSITVVNPTTIRVVFPTAIGLLEGAVVGKVLCDNNFYFRDSEDESLDSPIMDCMMPEGTTDTIIITLNSSFVPGTKMNVAVGSSLYVGPVTRDDSDNIIQWRYTSSYEAIPLRPALFGSSAVLRTPSTLTLSLPAASALPESTTTEQCNAAMELFGSRGALAAPSPIASCTMGPDASSVDLVLAPSYVYASGDSINVGPANAPKGVLRYADATGPAYLPADEPVPVLSTLSHATLESFTTMTVRLPTPSVVPEGFSSACASVLAVADSSMTTARTLESCSLSADGTAITVTIPATSYAAGDKVDVVRGQTDLRVLDLGVGSAFVPRAVTVQPAFFATDATLATPTTVTVQLPLPSALPSGLSADACNAALTLISATNVARNGSLAACSLAADKVTLTLTLAADGTYQAGDVVNVVSGQSALTLDDGATAYVPTTTAAPLIRPVIQSAVLPSPSTIIVGLPTPSATTGTNSDACSAAISVATSAGAAVSAPFASCSVSADGRSLELTAAPSYTPNVGDTLNVVPDQTVLRAGSARGPAYVAAATRVTLTVPSPPPPLPSSPPPPSPNAGNLAGRGLSMGYVVCPVAVSSSAGVVNEADVPTANGSFVVSLDGRVDTARFRAASCFDFVTGATLIDSTVASYLMYGMDKLVVSPITALSRAALPATASVAQLAASVSKMLQSLGLPVDNNAYKAVPLHAYDYYDATFITPSAAGGAVANLQGMISSNIKIFASWFDGLSATLVGKDLTAVEAVPAGQKSLAFALTAGPVSLVNNATVVGLLRTTYEALTGIAPAAPAAAAAAAHRRRQLLQGVTVANFSAVEATAAALTAAIVDSNQLVLKQQEVLLNAVVRGAALSPEQLQAAILSAARAIATQSTVLSSAAQALANGTLSADAFMSQYTGAALQDLVNRQELNSGFNGAAAPPAPGNVNQPSQQQDDDKDNKALIIGLVVGLVGGAIVIGVIVAVIVMRRRKQQLVANKSTPTGEV